MIISQIGIFLAKHEDFLIRQYHVADGKLAAPTPLGHCKIIHKGLWGKQFRALFSL
jgi:hypothetical protein